MPRRIPDYPDSFAGWNMVSSYGSIISVVASALFIYILISSFSDGAVEENNNNWDSQSFNTSDKTFKYNSPSANTTEFALKTPIPLHAYDSIPLLTQARLSSEDEISGRQTLS